MEQDDDAKPSKPSGSTETDTIALFGGKITMVTDTSAKVGSRYALVNANGTITFRFLPDIGAAAGANYTYKWTITDDETGEVLASNGTTDETVSASAITADTGNAIQKITATNIFSADGEYTITITDVKANSSKLALGTTFPAGVDKDKVAIGTSSGCSETTVADTNNLFLKFNPNTVNYNDKITVEFTVSNITGATLNATAVSAKKLTEITKATASNTTGKYSMEVALTNGGFSAVQVLDSITTTGTGSVVVTITKVDDESTKAKVKFTMDPSITWAELAGTTEATVTAGVQPAIDGDNFGGGDLQVKETGTGCVVSKVKAEYYYNGTKIHTSSAAISTSTTAATLTDTFTCTDAPAAKETMNIVIKLIPDEYTIPAADFAVTQNGGTNFAVAKDLIFDKDGKVKTNGADEFTLTSGKSCAVSVDGGTVVYYTGDGNADITAGEFTVDPAKLMNANNTTGAIKIEATKMTKIAKEKFADGLTAKDGNTTAPANTDVKVEWILTKAGGSSKALTAAEDLYIPTADLAQYTIKGTVTFLTDWNQRGSSANDITVGTGGTVGTVPTAIGTLSGQKVTLAGAITASAATKFEATWTGAAIVEANITFTLTAEA